MSSNRRNRSRETQDEEKKPKLTLDDLLRMPPHPAVLELSLKIKKGKEGPKPAKLTQQPTDYAKAEAEARNRILSGVKPVTEMEGYPNEILPSTSPKTRFEFDDETMQTLETTFRQLLEARADIAWGFMDSKTGRVTVLPPNNKDKLETPPLQRFREAGLAKYLQSGEYDTALMVVYGRPLFGQMMNLHELEKGLREDLGREVPTRLMCMHHTSSARKSLDDITRHLTNVKLIQFNPRIGETAEVRDAKINEIFLVGAAITVEGQKTHQEFSQTPGKSLSDQLLAYGAFNDSYLHWKFDCLDVRIPEGEMKIPDYAIREAGPIRPGESQQHIDAAVGRAAGTIQLATYRAVLELTGYAEEIDLTNHRFGGFMGLDLDHQKLLLAYETLQADGRLENATREPERNAQDNDGTAYKAELERALDSEELVWSMARAVMPFGGQAELFIPLTVACVDKRVKPLTPPDEAGKQSTTANKIRQHGEQLSLLDSRRPTNEPDYDVLAVLPITRRKEREAFAEWMAEREQPENAAYLSPLDMQTHTTSENMMRSLEVVDGMPPRIRDDLRRTVEDETGHTIDRLRIDPKITAIHTMPLAERLRTEMTRISDETGAETRSLARDLEGLERNSAETIAKIRGEQSRAKRRDGFNIEAAKKSLKARIENNQKLIGSLAAGIACIDPRDDTGRILAEVPQDLALLKAKRLIFDGIPVGSGNRVPLLAPLADLCREDSTMPSQGTLELVLSDLDLLQYAAMNMPPKETTITGVSGRLSPLVVHYQDPYCQVASILVSIGKERQLLWDRLGSWESSIDRKEHLMLLAPDVRAVLEPIKTLPPDDRQTFEALVAKTTGRTYEDITRDGEENNRALGIYSIPLLENVRREVGHRLETIRRNIHDNAGDKETLSETLRRYSEWNDTIRSIGNNYPQDIGKGTRFYLSQHAQTHQMAQK